MNTFLIIISVMYGIDPMSRNIEKFYNKHKLFQVPNGQLTIIKRNFYTSYRDYEGQPPIVFWGWKMNIRQSIVEFDA